MSSKHVIAGAAAGTALVGIALLAFHPRGKKIRKQIADIGLEFAEKAFGFIRENIPMEAGVEAVKAATGNSQRSQPAGGN
jgi:hypothetical protein